MNDPEREPGAGPAPEPHTASPGSGADAPSSGPDPGAVPTEADPGADPESGASPAPEEGRLTRRSVRSFVIRNGRLTGAQGDALERLLPRFGLPFAERSLDPETVFGRRAPLRLEIGFGNGDALVHMASERPDVDFIGCEVHAPGVGHALIGIEERALTNVRIIQHDAMEVLERMLAPAALDRVLLFFPDPWHKKRHHKRRIVQAEFLDAVARALAPNGLLHCATDWADYATWMLEHLEADARYENVAGPGRLSPRPDWRTSTRFERRGERLGHEVADLLYTRRPD